MDVLSKVYIRVDGRGCITRIEGEYTLPADLTGWTLLEEGAPCDRLNLAQSHYLDGGLCTADGVCRWKLVDGAAALRTDAELAADRDALPEPEHIPTPSELAAENALLRAQSAALAERGEFIEDCIAEMAMVLYS